MSHQHKGNKKTIIEDTADLDDLDQSSDESSGDEVDDKKDNITGKKRKYNVISQSVREKFIKRALSKEVTIKEAAKEFGLKFSTAKAILQTYKKEGRIGKKKNRERKLKVVNAIFIANINPSNPMASTINPIISVNEVKGPAEKTSVEENKNKLLDQALRSNPEHKIISQMTIQMPKDSNKSTQQFIKDLGNDFLKDFLEQNFLNSNLQNLNQPLQALQQVPNQSSNIATTTSNIRPNQLNNSITPQTLNILKTTPNLQDRLPNLTIPNAEQALWLASQQSLGGQQNLQNQPTLGNQQQLNQLMQDQMQQHVDAFYIPSLIPQHNLSGQSRLFTLEPERAMESDLARGTINDASVRRFRSGEEILFDFDYDKSKKDLEEFIFRTQNAIKNNSFVESKPFGNFNLVEAPMFDFTRYREQQSGFE